MGICCTKGKKSTVYNSNVIVEEERDANLDNGGRGDDVYSALYDSGMDSMVGKGRYGEIFKVRSRIDDSIVYAVKRISLDGGGCLHKEEEVGDMVDHPYSMKMIDRYYRDKKCVYIMRMCDGGDIASHMRDNTISESIVKRVVYQCVLVLVYLHDNSITHRDIKPDNILVVDRVLDIRSDVMLTDYGLSKVGKGRGEVMHSIVGTSYYVAPEVVNGNGYDNKCDCWSLGVTVYTMLSGSPPFVGKNNMETLELSMRCDVTFKSDVWKNVSGECKAFIKQLVRVDPKERMSMKDCLRHEWLMDIDLETELMGNRALPDDLKRRIDSSLSFSDMQLYFSLLCIRFNLLGEDAKKYIHMFFYFDNKREGYLDIDSFCRKLNKIGIVLDDVKMKRLAFITSTVNKSTNITYSTFIHLVSLHKYKEREGYIEFIYKRVSDMKQDITVQQYMINMCGILKISDAHAFDHSSTDVHSILTLDRFKDILRGN